MDFDGGANSSASNNDKKWSVNFTREELKDLFSLKECTLCDTHDLIGCGCGGVGRCGTDGAEHHNSVEVYSYAISYKSSTIYQILFLKQNLSY